jgi:hypothetical protein
MGRTRDRILGDAGPRGEKPRHKVAVLPRRRRNHGECVNQRDGLEVRPETFDLLLSVEDGEQITSPVYLSWCGAQSRNDGRVALHPLRRSRGETHRQQFPLLCHGERATPVLKTMSGGAA